MDKVATNYYIGYTVTCRTSSISSRSREKYPPSFTVLPDTQNLCRQ